MARKYPLDGKVVLITGATSGIGRACATAFAAEDAHLVLVGRRADRLESIAQDLAEDYRVGVHILELDIRNREEVFRQIAGLPKIWSQVRVLVNCAGVRLGRSLLEVGDAAQWDEMIDVNIKGLLWMTRAVLPGMLARGGGHVVNVCSTAAHRIHPNGNVYSATKNAVETLSKAVRLETLGRNIRVTNVSPGVVRTESFALAVGDKAVAEKFYASMTPLEPVDVAEAIVWATTRPEHVNVDEITIQPLDQAAAGEIHKKEE